MKCEFSHSAREYIYKKCMYLCKWTKQVFIDIDYMHRLFVYTCTHTTYCIYVKTIYFLLHNIGIYVYG